MILYKKRLIEMMRNGSLLGFNLKFNQLLDNYIYHYLGTLFYVPAINFRVGIYNLNINFDILGEVTEYVLLETITPNHFIENNLSYCLNITIKGIYVDEETIIKLSDYYYNHSSIITNKMKCTKLIRSQDYISHLDNKLYMWLCDNMLEVINYKKSQLVMDIYYSPTHTGDIFFDNKIKDNNDLLFIKQITINLNSLDYLDSVINQILYNYKNPNITIGQLTELTEMVIAKYWEDIRCEILSQITN